LKSIVKGYEIEEEVPVPYKHIYLRLDNSAKLEIWCFEQDIVIYKTLFDNTVSKKVAEIILSDKSKIQIELERGKAKKEKNIGLPYVIIETKSEQPNVHETLAYSRKAEMIKTIFPYCKYVFCIYGKVDPRTYRHGIAFDRIISIKNTRKNSQDMRDFKNQITELIGEAEKHLKRISKSGERNKR
jgi:hypothetical protein